MSGDQEALDVGRLSRRSSFSRRVVELRPGAGIDHHDTFWQGALVFVTAGELEIECSGGERHCFRTGDVLTLARLPIRRAHNTGTTATRLLAIAKRPHR